MTATEVARRFSSVLDSVERGEHVVITRNGRSIAELAPRSAANGAAVREALRRHEPDTDWADDIDAIRSLLYIEDRG